MGMNQIVVHGIVESDGTLKLDEPVPLPPGVVEVTIQLLSQTKSPLDPFWAAMEEIWAGQKARGHVPRSKTEIDAEIAVLRNEAEEEMLAADRIHAECRQAGKSPGRSSEGRR